MSETTKLQIRMDRKLKEAADEVFTELGIDSTTAVRMFFTKVARTQSIPFRLSVESEFSPEAEARILAAWKESKDPENLIGPFNSMGDFIKAIKSTPAAD